MLMISLILKNFKILIPLENKLKLQKLSKLSAKKSKENNNNYNLANKIEPSYG